MRKVLPYLGASLSVLALGWSSAAQAQRPFEDVKPDHWAYAAVQDLAIAIRSEVQRALTLPRVKALQDIHSRTIRQPPKVLTPIGAARKLLAVLFSFQPTPLSGETRR